MSCSDDNDIESTIPEEKWIEAEGNDQEDHDSEDEYGGGMTDLFADPDPYDDFSLTFSIRKGSSCLDRDTTNVKDTDHLDEKSNINNKTKFENSSSDFEESVNICLSGIKAENGQILNSTGLTLWTASFHLCNYIAYNPHIIRNKHVLELGAGLGLCGILAHRIGTKRCVITDGDTDTLKQMRHNVRLNLSEEEKSSSSSTISCEQLRWGRNLSSFRQRHIDNYKNRKENNDDPHNGLFDIIMGSDIIYVEEILEPLFETVTQLLSNQTNDNKNSIPKFLLAYARRNVSIDLVFNCAARYGFQWVEPDDTEGVFVFSRKPLKS